MKVFDSSDKLKKNIVSLSFRKGIIFINVLCKCNRAKLEEKEARGECEFLIKLQMSKAL